MGISRSGGAVRHQPGCVEQLEPERLDRRTGQPHGGRPDDERRALDEALAKGWTIAEDCIFVDDSKANVEGARAVGMHAIHFVEPMDLAAELRAHGIEA